MNNDKTIPVTFKRRKFVSSHVARLMRTIAGFGDPLYLRAPVHPARLHEDYLPGTYVERWQA